MPTGDAVEERPVRRPTVAAAKERYVATSLRRRRVAFTALLILIVIAIGYVDYITGPDIGLSLFYLGPIVAGAWVAGHRASILVALTAAVSWFLADYLLRVSLLLSLWNGLTRLVIYVGQGYLVAALREDRIREGILARTDSVTHLPNSRSFRESVKSAIGSGRAVALMYIDLDNFKRVNDLFGHAAGDAVLQAVADELRKAVRPSDVVARVGGDEFAILLHDIEPVVCELIAGRINEGMGVIARKYGGTDFGASVGVATSDSGDISAEQLLKLADDAMYEAKLRQKGTTAFVRHEVKVGTIDALG